MPHRSRTYLEKVLEKAREYLPLWLYRELIYAARAHAGGKARHGLIDKGEAIRKKYESLDNLPDDVKKLPKKRQRQWMYVFNSAWDRYDPEKHEAPNREAFAFAQAWAAVKSAMERVRKGEGELLVISKQSRKQIVYGVVYEPDTVDAQGDYASAEAIEEAAYDYMIRYRKGDAAIKFRHEKPVEAYLVESFIAPEDLEWGDVRRGTWVVAIHVPDRAIWEAIEDGELVGFSMGGVVLDAS